MINLPLQLEHSPPKILLLHRLQPLLFQPQPPSICNYYVQMGAEKVVLFENILSPEELDQFFLVYDRQLALQEGYSLTLY